MIEYKQKARRLVYQPANPATWGSVETWRPGRLFDCAYHSNSAERNVRAGRDSDEQTVSLYYDQSLAKLNNTDRVLLSGREYAIMYLRIDSTGEGESLAELKAL
jgi:hypothetical protein